MKRWKIALIVGGVAFAIFVVMFCTVGIPNVAGNFQENATISKLQRHAGQDEIVGLLRLVHANWRRGISWETGNSYGSFESASPCSKNCAGTVQVAFDHGIGLCVGWGDVVTMRFDSKGRLESWKSEPSADGC